ncbi:MAG: hypothetical protein JWL96_4663, partial [Sphingomonas bacterium]|nr:hypothetical protein [Sphingomonas bacterium]
RARQELPPGVRERHELPPGVRARHELPPRARARHEGPPRTVARAAGAQGASETERVPRVPECCARSATSPEAKRVTVPSSATLATRDAGACQEGWFGPLFA